MDCLSIWAGLLISRDGKGTGGNHGPGAARTKREVLTWNGRTANSAFARRKKENYDRGASGPGNERREQSEEKRLNRISGKLCPRIKH